MRKKYTDDVCRARDGMSFLETKPEKCDPRSQKLYAGFVCNHKDVFVPVAKCGLLPQLAQYSRSENSFYFSACLAGWCAFACTFSNIFFDDSGMCVEQNQILFQFVGLEMDFEVPYIWSAPIFLLRILDFIDTDYPAETFCRA